MGAIALRPPAAEWGSRRARVAAVLLALLPYLVLAAIGGDTATLGVAAATGSLLVAALAMIASDPPLEFWSRAWPALALAALATLWLVLPESPLASLVPGGVAAQAHRPAPDLVPSELARRLGMLGLLVAGGAIGYRRGMARLALAWMVGFGLLYICLSLVLREIDPLHVWGMSKNISDAERFTGTLLNANASACAFGVIAVLALGRLQLLVREQRFQLISGKVPTGVVIAGLAVVGGLGACASTGSRAAFLLTLLITGSLVVIEAYRRSRLGQWVKTGAIAVLFVIAAGFVISLVGDITVERLNRLDSDTSDRIEIWSHYWALAQQAPAFGHGPGASSEASLASLNSPLSATLFWYINDAHNVILQILVEGGWGYLALLAATMAAILWGCRRLFTARADDPMARGVLGALLLALGCSLVDIALSIPGVQALALVPLALLWGRELRGRSRA